MSTKLSFVGEKVKLGKVCKIVTGNTPSTKCSEFYANKDIQFYKPGDFDNMAPCVLRMSESWIAEPARKKARIVSANSILITCIGVIGKVGITTKEAAFNQQINAVLPPSYLDSKYLAHQLFYKAKALRKQANQAVVPILNKSSFAAIQINLPSLDVQYEISNSLNSILQIIQDRYYLVNELEQLVKSRFVEMFGEEVEEKTALNNLIKANSSISYGIVQPGSDGTGKLGVIRPVDIEDNILNYSNIKYIDPIIGERYKKTLLDGKEILLIVRGATGGVALTDERVAGMNVTRGIAVIRYDEQKIDPVFLLNYLKSDESQRFIANHTQGATLKQINLSDLRKQPILLPNFQRQKEFSVFAKQVDKLRFVKQ